MYTTMLTWLALRLVVKNLIQVKCRFLTKSERNFLNIGSFFYRLMVVFKNMPFFADVIIPMLITVHLPYSGKFGKS